MVRLFQQIGEPAGRLLRIVERPEQAFHSGTVDLCDTAHRRRNDRHAGRERLDQHDAEAFHRRSVNVEAMTPNVARRVASISIKSDLISETILPHELLEHGPVWPIPHQGECIRVAHARGAHQHFDYVALVYARLQSADVDHIAVDAFVVPLRRPYEVGHDGRVHGLEPRDTHYQLRLKKTRHVDDAVETRQHGLFQPFDAAIKLAAERDLALLGPLVRLRNVEMRDHDHALSQGRAYLQGGLSRERALRVHDGGPAVAQALVQGVFQKDIVPVAIPPHARLAVHAIDHITHAKHRIHQSPLRVEGGDDTHVLPARQQIILERIEMRLDAGRAMLVQQRGDDDRGIFEHLAHIVILESLTIPLQLSPSPIKQRDQLTLISTQTAM